MITMLIALFTEFFKIGLFAVGGGLATLPFLYSIAEKYDWLDANLLPDMIAVSESTPGPIGVNMATYCGFNAGYSIDGLGAGILSGIFATLALVLPSLIVIIIVARVLERFKNSTLVKNSFDALRPAVCGLIAATALTVFASACLNVDVYNATGKIADLANVKAIVLFVIIFAVNLKFKPHPIFLIIPAAIVGIIFKM